MYAGGPCALRAPSRTWGANTINSQIGHSYAAGPRVKEPRAPQALVQLPTPALDPLPLRGARQTRRVRRARQHPAAERVDHSRDERVLRTHVVRALLRGLLLAPRSERGCLAGGALGARSVITRASGDLRAVRVVA